MTPTPWPRPASGSRRSPTRRASTVLGWREVPVDDSTLGATARSVMPSFAQVFVAGRGARVSGMALERLAFCLRKRAESETEVYFPSLSSRTLAYKGMLDHRPARPGLPRPDRRAGRLGDGGRALALLHQHLPELAAGPPVPVHRPQRRDQHRDGQPQLDARPRGAPRERPDPRRPRAALPDLHARRLGLRVVRRGPRAAAPRRPLAAARGADDDPGGVGEPPRDGRQATRVLRVPLHADGAVGRTGVRGLHRRHPDRRGARPQRPAPLALLGHRRRPRRARLRGRRARPRPRHGGPQGPPAAGPDVPRRHRGAPDHRGRGDQEPARRRAPLRRVAARRADPPRRHRRPRAHRPHARLGDPSPADLRLHRGGAARPAEPDGQHRR